MKFFPQINYELRTNKSKDEIIESLRLHTICSKKRPSFFTAGDGKRFWGTIKDTDLKIIPLLSGGNSFRPIINGNITISENNNESIINISMQIFKYIKVSMVLFMVLSVIFMIIMLSIVASDIGISVFMFLPIFFYFFAYGLMHISFRHEKQKTIKYLLKILDTTSYIQI